MLRNTLTSKYCLAALIALTACKTEEPATRAEPPPTTQNTAPPDAGPAAPPEPKIALADAPALPTKPAGLPDAEVSKDNPTTAEKADLGYRLFFDKRLSKDDSMACAQCHDLTKSWATNNVTDPKVGGGANKRNTPQVVNLGYHGHGWYWDGRMPTLEAVCNAAWKGQLGADPAAVATKLAGDKVVKAYFMRAFNAGPTADNVPQALAAFLRTLLSGNSAFDKFAAGDKKALSADAQKGYTLFAAKGCVNCHVPPMFSDFDFHAIGIGSAKPDDQKDHGRMDATKDAANDGQFMTPSLRNVEHTGPYFHDGSAATLDDAIATMAAGGPKGVKVDEKLKAQKLSKKEAEQLKAFLLSLSGEATYNKPADGFAEAK
jgi:cytochrome c peroxidase